MASNRSGATRRPSSPSQTVKVTGLDQIAADFRDMGPGLQKAVAELTPEIATYVAKVGVDAAKTKAERKVAGSAIMAKGSTVVIGGTGSDAERMALGTEFGGRRRKTTMQFRPHRGREGYFFWPSVRSHSDEIKKKWDALLDRLISG